MDAIHVKIKHIVIIAYSDIKRLTKPIVLVYKINILFCNSNYN
jgi:hypothetical protein